MELDLVGGGGHVASVTRPVGVHERARVVEALVRVRAEVIALRLQNNNSPCQVSDKWTRGATRQVDPFAHTTSKVSLPVRDRETKMGYSQTQRYENDARRLMWRISLQSDQHDKTPRSHVVWCGSRFAFAAYLQDISWKPGRPVSVIEGESWAERRERHAVRHAFRYHASPRRLQMEVMVLHSAESDFQNYSSGFWRGLRTLMSLRRTFYHVLC